MTDTNADLHVVWGVSRADSVRDALRMHGQTAQVIALSGALSHGPIDQMEPGARGMWAAANMYDDDDEDDGHIEWHEP